VDVTCLPTGYSTGVPPLPELCDDCYKILDNDSSGTYYKDGIYKNVNSLLERLEKGADTFSENDGIEEELQDLDEELEGSEHENIQEKDVNLQTMNKAKGAVRALSQHLGLHFQNESKAKKEEEKKRLNN
ncbi:12646_t:CDS:2, partial [Funneliformis caledonium]